MPILKHSACDSVNLKYNTWHLWQQTFVFISQCYSWFKNRNQRTKEQKYKSIHADIVLDWFPRAFGNKTAVKSVRQLRTFPGKLVFLLRSSLPASSPFGGYREKFTRERHARGDATAAPRGFAACSRVLARLASLASLAQIGELARRLTMEIHYT